MHALPGLHRHTQLADGGAVKAKAFMTPSFTPSLYQEAIFEFVRHGAGNAVIEAVAGSGKSTTLLKALGLLPPTTSAAFLAFNREIARHLGSRAPKHVTVSTLHRLGYQAVRCKGPDVAALNEHKMDAIVETLIAGRPRKSKAVSSLAEVRGELRRLISLAKAMLVDPCHRSTVAQLMDRYGLSLGADVDTVSTLLDEALVVGHVA